MGRSPCCDEEMSSVKKGPWTVEEDEKLKEYIKEKGHGSWRALPKLAGLNRCGKSCRLRWTNYLRPDIKRGKFTEEEERQIIHLHSIKGNKWSEIARHLPGRTDNEIKNLWNTHLRKKLLKKGIDPVTHQPRLDLAVLADLPNLLSTTFAATSFDHTTALRLHSDAANLAKLKVLQNLLQVFVPSGTDNNIISSTPSTMLAAAPLNVIDPTQNLPTNYQSHLLNQSSFPADMINPIDNVTLDLQSNHVEQQNMISSSNINGASGYNVTLLQDMVDLNNYYEHGTREQSCSTSTVTGSSTTSLESTTGAAEVYNPWISELLCGDFELMDAVDQSNN